MGVNSLPKTVTRQRRSRDLNPGPSVPESSTLTTRLPSHPRETTKFSAHYQYKGVHVHTCIQALDNASSSQAQGLNLILQQPVNGSGKFPLLRPQLR